MAELEQAANRGKASRQRLIKATQRLIAAKGWGGVTTRAVAEAASVNQGLVHYHFGSVDQLRRVAVMQLMDELTQISMGTLSEADDPARGMREMLEGFTTAQRADRTASVVLFEAFLAALRDEELRRHLVSALRQARQALAEIIAGRVPGSDAESLATLVSAALDGIYLHWLLDPDTNPTVIADVLSRLVDTSRSRSTDSGGDQ